MSNPDSNNPHGFWKMNLFLIMAGAVVLSLSPVSAEKPFVTIIAQGDQSYYNGEKVVFSGTNTGSDSTYLFITGPNLPDNGANPASPDQDTVSGNPGSFTQIKIREDSAWEYPWFTSGLKLDAGSYTVYAVTKPETIDQFNDLTNHATVKIIHKKPFIITAISPKPVQKGQPFVVSGSAEGDPSAVQLWILGTNFFSLVTVPVDREANYTFTADAEFSNKLAAGDYYLIAEHSMADNRFDFTFDGQSVIATQDNTSTALFRVRGPGSLQGRDAADALVFALSENEHGNETYARDTHAIVAFTINETGYSPQGA